MSLINDALKRAQETQKKSPPPLAGAPLHSVPDERKVTLWVPILVVLVVSLIACGLYAFLSERFSGLKVEFPKIQNPTSQKNIQPAPPTAVPAANIPVAAPPPVSPAPMPVAPPVAAEPTPAPAPPVAAVEVPPSQPAWPKLKLQGIFFLPRKPSVVINNKALFIGERVAGAQVVAIAPDSVTLVFAGQTNVLTVP